MNENRLYQIDQDYLNDVKIKPGGNCLIKICSEVITIEINTRIFVIVSPCLDEFFPVTKNHSGMIDRKRNCISTAKYHVCPPHCFFK